jgi:hypothetical protein
MRDRERASRGRGQKMRGQCEVEEESINYRKVLASVFLFYVLVFYVCVCTPVSCLRQCLCVCVHLDRFPFM